jgi:arylsulfatase
MPDQRPNILWICTDQQRYDTIHALNNPVIRTPNLDRLCAEGVAFTRAYSQSPICTPSRVSFLTGRYPSTVHVNRNGDAWFPTDKEPGLVTRTLRDVEYDCGLSGKLHLTAADGRVEQLPPDRYGYRVFKLYDLQEDPEEFVNLWDDAKMQTVKYDLMKRLFDAVMLAVDEGIERVGRY